MLSAPLIIGCDLTRLDEFTLNLLTDDEVIAIDQDPLGKQAVQVLKDGDIRVWVKDVADGTKTVGIFNLGTETTKYKLDLKKAGLKQTAELRDIWRQKSFGKFSGNADLMIPSHGVLLLKEMKRIGN